MKKAISHLLIILAAFYSRWVFCRRNRLIVIGQENIPVGYDNLLVSKHGNLWDTAVIILALMSNREITRDYRRIPYTAANKDNFAKKPARKFWVSFLKTIPIVRNGKSRDIQNEQVRKMRSVFVGSEPGNLIVFPEGQPMPDGEIGECRYGVGELIRTARIKAVVPIYLDGVDRVVRPTRFFNPFDFSIRQTVTVAIGKPIRFSDGFDRETNRREVRDALNLLREDFLKQKQPA